jgi:hypothetical protein
MEILAFVSFAVLVVAWLVAPSRAPIAVAEAEERAAA